MTKKKIEFDFDLGLDLEFDLDLDMENEIDFNDKFTELCMRKIQKKKKKHLKEEKFDPEKCSKDKEGEKKDPEKPIKSDVDLKPIELGDLFDNKKVDCSKENKHTELDKTKCPKREKHPKKEKTKCSKADKNLKKLKHLKDLDKLDDLDDLKHLKKLKHLNSKKDCSCKMIKKFKGKRVSIRMQSGETLTGIIRKVKKNGCVVIDQCAMTSSPAPTLRTITKCKNIESISKLA